MKMLAGLILLCSAAVEARAADTWTTPFLGVRRLHRTSTDPALNINVAVIDLDTPGVSLRSTAYDERGRRPSAFATQVGAQVAINGDFYNPDLSTLGLSAGNGAAWPNNHDKDNTGNLAFGTSRVELFHPTAIVSFDPTWMKGVVSGLMAVVWDGTVFPVAADPLCSARHPRTSVGLSADKRTLYLAVVDGRSIRSRGMTCGELGTLMHGLGAQYAINLDGGGSSAMYVAGSGIVSSPSGGAERVVSNHLAVFAPGAAHKGTMKGVVYEAPDTARRIAGATLLLSDGSTAVTSDTGSYELKLAPGVYAVTAKKPGFAAATKSQTVTLGADVWNSIGLSRSPTADFDEDGVPDATDNCAEVQNPSQANAEGDALGDACDPDNDNNGLFDEDEERREASPAGDGVIPPTPAPADARPPEATAGCSVLGGSGWLLAALGAAAFSHPRRRQR